MKSGFWCSHFGVLVMTLGVWGVMLLALVLFVLIVMPTTASGESVTNAPAAQEQSKLGVIVTNELDTNIAVFSTGGARGCQVAPGGTCFVPYPPGWPMVTVRVERCDSNGDFSCDSEERVYQTDKKGRWRVKRHEF